MRALVVEDEPLVADAVARALRRSGLVVAVAGNATDGLHEASESAYDVIVLDVMLPDGDGFTVVRELRVREVWTPVLMLTARDADRDVAGALDLGADDYLTKPFSIAVLQARVRALLRRGGTERPAQLRAGNLMLDPASHRCSRGDRAIELTAREFAVLHFLMRHQDEVVGKTTLLDHCWDANYDGDVNVVEVYVGYLRRKVDEPFRRHAIETVGGAGYRLRSDGG